MDTDTPAAAAPEALAFRYTRDRFPLRPCTRCLGTGTYSRCATWGTTCFQCGVIPGQPGSGRALASAKVRTIYTEWDEARRATKTVLGDRVQVGDVLAVDRETLRPADGKGRVWATVTAVEQIPGAEGTWSSRSERDGQIVYGGWVTLSLRANDGREATHERIGANRVLDRKGHVDPRPYAARAWASLSRRQRAEVVNPEAEAAASVSA
jgi:hypothetical protein